MNTLIPIGNPYIHFASGYSWIEIRHQIINVVSKLPHEYAIIKTDIDKIVLLVIPKQLSERVILKDQIIYIAKEKSDSTGSTIKIVLTNEGKEINSYGELYLAKRALETFTFQLQRFQKIKIAKLPSLKNSCISFLANSNHRFFKIIATLLLLTTFVYVLSGLITAMRA